MPRVAELKDQVDRIWLASFHTDLADTLTQQLRVQALQGVQATLEAALREEVAAYRDHLRASARAAARTPSLFRCAGQYRRRVLTSYGLIPRPTCAQAAQRQCRPSLAHPHALPARHAAGFGSGALSVYPGPLDPRSARGALPHFWHVLSREAVNRVTIAAQSPMQVWRERTITDTPPILIVDGVWVQILAPTGQTWTDRSGHTRAQMRGEERVVLAVMGVWEDGRHEILHYQAADAESTESWSAVLASLKRRGLASEAVRIVVSDGTTGLPAALQKHLPTAQQQRCTVHKIRGLEQKFCYRDLVMTDPSSQETLSFEQARRLRRLQLTTDAHAIFEAPTRTEALERLASFRTTWGTLEGEVVRLLAKDIELNLTFYQFDVSLHPLVRSTNLLSRFFREFRTKADEIGSFPNELTCLTVFHLMVVRDHAKHDRGKVAQTG